MPSNNPNIFKRAYENVMGTPEQNKKAKEDIEKYKASKAKEKAIYLAEVEDGSVFASTQNGEWEIQDAEEIESETN